MSILYSRANYLEPRAHLQKHEKLYKCDIPGCKNKKGFARIDQLKRHKQVVSHG